MYKIPDQYYFRIHHVRPRFKDDVENVLFYMAHCCSSLKDLPINEYKEKLNTMIQLYPENAGKTEKTINNWRTEIAALFGFYIEDKNTQKTETGEIAYFLDKEQDLVQFFKFYLFKFQYPGGHLKSDRIKEFIDAGIKFKPAHYILKLLYEADSECRGHERKHIRLCKRLSFMDCIRRTCNRGFNRIHKPDSRRRGGAEFHERHDGRNGRQHHLRPDFYS